MKLVFEFFLGALLNQTAMFPSSVEPYFTSDHRESSKEKREGVVFMSKVIRKGYPVNNNDSFRLRYPLRTERTVLWSVRKTPFPFTSVPVQWTGRRWRTSRTNLLGRSCLSDDRCPPCAFSVGAVPLLLVVHKYLQVS